jgi:hypothetical protein
VAPPSGEKRFYGPLREWLGKRGYYTGEATSIRRKGKEKTAWFKEKGIQGQIADVIGVRNAGSRHHDALEVVIIEVKDSERFKVRDLQDAKGYTTISHLTYLAHTVKPNEDKIEKARDLGIGLIHIIDRKHFKEILSPVRNEPNERSLAEFLENLFIIQCSLCRCYFFNWSHWTDDTGVERGKTFVEMRRIKQFNWARQNPNETSPFEIIESQVKVDRAYVIHPHLCISCVGDLTKLAKLANQQKK